MANWTYDDAALNEQIARSTEAARQADITEPRAISASYDSKDGRIVVELSNGAIFSVPSILCQGISGVPSRSISKVEITPAGDGLYWEELDVDLGLHELVKGIYGTRPWMTELGRKGGRTTSPAKAAAARTNGLRGGRPRARAAAATARKK